jgi:hypothetical protein
MDRFKPRNSGSLHAPRVRGLTAGLAACGLAAAFALTGCGAGQVSQMATQEAAVNGTSATLGTISLRNIHLRAPQSTDYVQPGRDVELLFVAVNGSPDVNDKLISITSDVGTVSLSGDTSLPAASRTDRSRPWNQPRRPMPPRQGLRCPSRSPTG